MIGTPLRHLSPEFMYYWETECLILESKTAAMVSASDALVLERTADERGLQICFSPTYPRTYVF